MRGPAPGVWPRPAPEIAAIFKASYTTSGDTIRANRIIAMVRAKVEHPFRVLKRQFGHVKTRYRGLTKNRAQIFTLFALGNLFLMRRRLMA